VKIVGRWGEEQVAERVRNPVSGTVVGGWDRRRNRAGQPARTWTPSTSCAEGERNPRRGASRREMRGGDFRDIP
jgi:hypothetical protein